MRQLFGFYLFLVLLTFSFESSPVFASASRLATPHDVNLTYRFLVCVNAVFFIGILVAMAIFVVKNRKSALDMIWSMVPAIMLIVIVGLGWANFRDHHSGETFYAVKFTQ